jgi:hypothetical protein
VAGSLRTIRRCVAGRGSLKIAIGTSGNDSQNRNGGNPPGPSFPAAESVKQTRFRVNHPSVMSDNKPPVDPLHIASQAPVQESKKKGPNESKTTNRMKDQAKLSKTMKTQSEPSRRH